MKLETFFDNFEVLAEVPNGVKKLREMILQLAVKGKLVAQDEKDEPASMLLERIIVEREKLVKEGKIKETGKFTIENKAVTFELPSIWKWTCLCQIGIINPRNIAEDNKEVSFIPMTLISETSITPIDSEKRRWGEVKKGFTHFAEDDIVLAKITPCFQNGKSAVMHGLINKLGAGTTELHVFRPILNESVNPEYVLLYLRSPQFLSQGIEKMTGTAGQKRVPKEYFAGNPFPLPPFEEQHRIVAKVDQLMSLCDELEARQQKKRETCARINSAALDRLLAARAPGEFAEGWQRIGDNFDLLYDSPENVGALRQAILQLAVMGKLVAQDEGDEPASVLFEQIKAEKERMIKKKEIRPEKTMSPIAPEKMPFEVPKGWIWKRLGEIAKSIEYGTSYKSLVNNIGVPVFRMNNIDRGKIIHEKLKYVPNSIDDLPKLFLQHNDLLFNRTNSYELVGKTGIFKGESDVYTFASYLIRISLFMNYIHPDYVNLAMNSGYFRKTQIEPEIVQQCGQANFNGTKLANTVIPLPPMEEQHRIVARVDQLMSLCDQLEAGLRRSQADSEKLMEAMVGRMLAGGSSNK